MNFLRRLIQPLRSRKVRTALATVAAAFAAQLGLNVSENLAYVILGAGAAVILGIAYEDAATPPDLRRPR